MAIYDPLLKRSCYEDFNGVYFIFCEANNIAFETLNLSPKAAGYY